MKIWPSVTLSWVIILFAMLTEAQEGPQWNCKPSRTCYSSDNSKTDYLGAEERCHLRGGVLACPSTNEKVEEFYSFIQHKEDGYWVGLQRYSSVDEWEWLDGSWYYTDVPWATGHRLNNKTLAYFRNKTFFSTSEPTQHLYYACQIDEDHLPSSPSSSIPTSISTETTRPTQQPMRENYCRSNNPSSLAFIDRSSDCGDNDGWSKSPETDYCYYYAYTGSLPWAELKEKCEKIGGHLAVPSTAQKLKELLAYIQYRDPCLYEKSGWIGLYLPETVSTTVSSEVNKKLSWTWVDGSSYYWSTAEWSHGEPEHKERWVRLSEGKFYATFNVSDVSYYICQKDTTVTAFMPGPSASNATYSPLGAASSSPAITESSIASISPESWSSLTISSTTTEPSTHQITMMPTPEGRFKQNAQVCGDHEGWYLHTASNTCYLLEESHQSTWREIRQKYSQQKGDLASPSTPEKYREILAFIEFKSANTVNVWIGLHCKADIESTETCSNWEWVDGSPFSMEWNEWANTGEPGRGEKWVRVRETKWYASNDENDAQYFICEKAGRWINMPPMTPAPPPQSSTSADSQTPEINVTANKTNGTQRNINLLALLLLIPLAIFTGIAFFLTKRREWPCQKNGESQHAAELGTVSREGVYEYIDHSALRVEYENLYQAMTKNLSQKQYERLGNTGFEGAFLGKTAIPVSEFLSAYEEVVKSDSTGLSRLDHEFQLMNNLLSKYNKQSIKSSTLVVNPIFNLDWKVKFIATGKPPRGPKADWWQAVWDFNCHMIIMLCTPGKLGKSGAYYPEVVGDNHSISPFEVKCDSILQKKHFTRTDLSVLFHENEEHSISHLNVASDLHAQSAKDLQEVFKCIHEYVKKKSNKLKHAAPTLVHCLDGAEWTGLYGAFSFLLDQINAKNEIDIFQVVSRIKFCDGKSFATRHQYALLYEMMFQYIKDL